MKNYKYYQRAGKYFVVECDDDREDIVRIVVSEESFAKVLCVIFAEIYKQSARDSRLGVPQLLKKDLHSTVENKIYVMKIGQKITPINYNSSTELFSAVVTIDNKEVPFTFVATDIAGCP